MPYWCRSGYRDYFGDTLDRTSGGLGFRIGVESAETRRQWVNGVVRGGGYQTRSQYARSDMRYTTGKGGGYDYRGFRCEWWCDKGSAF